MSDGVTQQRKRSCLDALDETVLFLPAPYELRAL